MSNLNSDNIQLIRFFFAFRQEADSWSDFLCLHIDFDDNNVDLASGAEAIFSSYLQHIYYKIFRTDHKTLYLLCRERDFSAVTQALQQVEFYTLWEKHCCLAKFYFLSQDGDAFTQHLQDTIITLEQTGISTSLFYKIPKAHNPTNNPNHVLLVEDDPVTRWMLRQIMRDNCLLATASCAHQVFSLYNSWRPSLIFLDIHLPDGSGEEILHWIAALKATFSQI